jgi:hypothetical protein
LKEHLQVTLVRNLLGSALTCALTLGVAPGCKPNKPDGTNPPDGSSSKAGKRRGAKKGGDGGALVADGDDGGEGDDAGAAASCEAKVADAPTPLFDEKVLIRPPVNVELVEENPAYATTYASSGFVSACDATVDRMHVFVFPDQKRGLDKELDEFIDVYLVKAGFKDGSRKDNFLSTETDMHTAVEYPSAGGQPPAVLYVASARRFTNVFMIVYQTRPDEFSALKPSFKASAESLLVIPDDA